MYIQVQTCQQAARHVSVTGIIANHLQVQSGYRNKVSAALRPVITKSWPSQNKPSKGYYANLTCSSCYHQRPTCNDRSNKWHLERPHNISRWLSRVLAKSGHEIVSDVLPISLGPLLKSSDMETVIQMTDRQSLKLVTQPCSIGRQNWDKLVQVRITFLGCLCEVHNEVFHNRICILNLQENCLASSFGVYWVPHRIYADNHKLVGIAL